MSRIILNCICPKCYSENITYEYDEEDTNIVCNCSDCGWNGKIMETAYIMEDYDE